MIFCVISCYPTRLQIMKEFIWLKNYPKEIPHLIDPDKYDSVLALFEESVSKYGDAPAFENMGKRISYNQLDVLSTQFAAYLQTSARLEKGDRIAIQMPNLLQYVVVMFGAIKAGLVAPGSFTFWFSFPLVRPIIMIRPLF